MPEMPLLSVYPNLFCQSERLLCQSPEYPLINFWLLCKRSMSFLNRLYAIQIRTFLFLKLLLWIRLHESDTDEAELTFSHLHLIRYILQSFHVPAVCAKHFLQNQCNLLPDCCLCPASRL